MTSLSLFRPPHFKYSRGNFSVEMARPSGPLRLAKTSPSSSVARQVKWTSKFLRLNAGVSFFLQLFTCIVDQWQLLLYSLYVQITLFYFSEISKFETFNVITPKDSVITPKTALTPLHLNTKNFWKFYLFFTSQKPKMYLSFTVWFVSSLSFLFTLKIVALKLFIEVYILRVTAYCGMEENLLEKLVENLRLGLSALSRLTFQWYCSV